MICIQNTAHFKVFMVVGETRKNEQFFLLLTRIFFGSPLYIGVFVIHRPCKLGGM